MVFSWFICIGYYVWWYFCYIQIGVLFMNSKKGKIIEKSPIIICLRCGEHLTKSDIHITRGVFKRPKHKDCGGMLV